MRIPWCLNSPIRFSCVALGVLGLSVLAMTSCGLPGGSRQSTEIGVNPGWPKGNAWWRETSSEVLPAGWSHGKQLWQASSYSELRSSLPEIAGAEVVQVDQFCKTCHETHVDAFRGNVHRNVNCEKCHGAASLHLQGMGRRPNTILSLQRQDNATPAGKLTSPAERSEVCLQCHENGEQDAAVPCLADSQWRTSAHAHRGVACTDCHTSHYNVPPGTPATVARVREPEYGVVQTGLLDNVPGPHAGQSLRGKSHDLGAVSPDVCYRCHTDMVRLEEVVHPHQLGVPFNFECTSCHASVPRGAPRAVENHPQQFNCTTCHDPHGNVKPETREDLCLKCHDGAHMNQWHSSPHDLGKVGCTDCHNPHPRTGLPMSVDQPGVCYRCHSEKRQLEEIAHPHQILGPNNFNCSTCHDPHGKISLETRKDLCLECHKGAPTMAWQSSKHEQYAVACADCHKAHPETAVPQVVSISRTTVVRPKRLPMSVDEPQACYKCHQEIYGLTALPSRHPIQEGKMVCSSCHDAHGQSEGNLKADSINELCYECHAEKEGPFAYEHQPATENCAYCHEPHGTIANNLLRQPPMFLCLRCHSGHSTHAQFTDGDNSNFDCTECHEAHDLWKFDGNTLDDMGAPDLPARQALFTDCTQCHTQVHGSDLPSGLDAQNRMFR